MVFVPQTIAETITTWQMRNQIIDILDDSAFHVELAYCDAKDLLLVAGHSTGRPVIVSFTRSGKLHSVIWHPSGVGSLRCVRNELYVECSFGNYSFVKYSLH